MYGSGNTTSVLNHVPPLLTLNENTTLQTGDIAMLCDDTLAAIFQVAATAPNVVSHAVAAPLNCSQDLGFQSPLVCADSRPRVFPGGAMLMRFESALWLVAASADNPAINSLYREIIIGGNVVREEVLFGVSSLNFAYQDGSVPFVFGPVAFSPAVVMNNVVGVQVILVMDPNAYTNANLPLAMRTIQFFASVRNRLR